METISRAPGKIIITGEHFVVHGAKALVAAIDRYVEVSAKPSDTLEMANAEDGAVWSGRRLSHRSVFPYAEMISALERFLGQRVRLRLTTRSSLPTSAGLGSSAAVAVATIAAASSHLGHKMKPEEMYNLAMVAERLIHGRPSGIDIRISINGGVLLFTRGGSEERVELRNGIGFGIGCTGVRRRTSEMISRVELVRRRFPDFFGALVESSSRFGELEADALKNGDLKTAGAILNFHHAALSWLGVSTPPLDDLVAKSLSLGCHGAKLTGGGGGGCMIFLPKQGDADHVVSEIRGTGREAFIARIPVGGVSAWRRA